MTGSTIPPVELSDTPAPLSEGVPSRRHADRAASPPPEILSALDLAAGNESLTRNLRTLKELYGEAVGRLTEKARGESDLRELSGWALRVSPSGWAIVRSGRLRLTNASFDRLNRSVGLHPRWHTCRPPLGREPLLKEEFLSLRELVLTEAGRLLAGDQPIRQGRFERGTQVVEITFERSLRLEAEATLLVVVRDITDLAQVETQLAAARERLVQQERERIVGQVATGVAHDLGNLLGAVGFRMAALQAEVRTVGPPGENLKAMKQILQSGSDLLGHLRALARSHHEPEAPVDLNVAVGQAIEVAESGLRLWARERRIEIAIESRLPLLAPVRGNDHELRNLFVNLLLNARDAMPLGGTITIDGERRGDLVVVRVEDEGTGIPPAALRRIFDPFFSTKGQQGMGMGLATCRNLMQRLGGEIRARNRADGGASFEVRLRLWKP